MPLGVWVLSPRSLVRVSYQDLSIPAPSVLHALQAWASGHGWYSWRELAASFPAAGSVTLQLVLPEYGQGAASECLASSLSLMSCVSFLQAQLFIQPVFKLLGRDGGTHKSDPGGGLDPRTCLETMSLSHIYHLF